MRKTVVWKGLSCLIIINWVCLLLAGCGAGNSADNSVGGGNGQNIAANDPAGSSNFGGNEQDGIGDPAYNPNGRQVLTAVVVFPWITSDIQERIRAFNENSQSYFVETKRYVDEAWEDVAGELDKQLPLEILSGKGPDLVIWNASYTPALASEKLMENLYDFMDADPDFHREDYFENILQAFEVDGGLYVLPTSFSVSTMCGKVEELGADRGIMESWEFGEMLEAYENSPHAKMLSDYPNREYTLNYVGSCLIGNYVDWSSGECYFDTPSFVELLEFCKTLPEGFENLPDSYCESFQNGEIFIKPTGLATPWSMAHVRAVFGDADLLWPGYPVADGEKEIGGGLAVPRACSFSICKNSGSQEGAWEFIKSCLTIGAQREVEDNPLLRSAFEEKIQEALTVEYETVDGIEQEKIRYEVIVSEVDDIIGFSCITEEDAEIYRSLIENTHRSIGGNSGIMDIIMEEAGAYFENDKDASTVADIIQNRVRIYVSERM